MSEQPSRIVITLQPRRGTDTRRALQAALKYMGRLGLACTSIRDIEPGPSTTSADETQQAGPSEVSGEA